MNDEARHRLEDDIRASLAMVIDPELGENVIDLGFIYGVAVDDAGAAQIAMTTTTQGSPVVAYLKDAVRSAAWIVPGVAAVEVRLIYEPRWLPERMSDDARLRLERLASEWTHKDVIKSAHRPMRSASPEMEGTHE